MAASGFAAHDGPRRSLLDSGQPADATLQLVQLTDTHLCRRAGQTLVGVDTDYSLQAVIDLLRGERGAPGVLLGTGDLSDDGAPEAYGRLREYLAQVRPEYFLLPGNHDDFMAMQAHFDANVLSNELYIGRWQILLLNSLVPGRVGGRLGAEQLKWLDRALEDGAGGGRHALVFLHHQPVPIGCAWLDQQMVADADAFFEVLDNHRHVRAVVWGHVHQDFESTRNGVSLLATPSTCVQFAPGSERFRADARMPGYRWFDLHPDGQFASGISRVVDPAIRPDLESTGYG